MGELDWMDDAPCKGKTALFFDRHRTGRHPGDGGEPRPTAAQVEALALCRACPHQVPCRERGRATGSHGIWGGETEVQRVRAGFGGGMLNDGRALQKARAAALAEARMLNKQEIAGELGVSRRTVHRLLRDQRTG